MDSPATSIRKLRRSWFDAPPLTSLDPSKKMGAAAASTSTKRLSEDAVETLLLTHFNKPPKLNFGKIILGKTKTRTLHVRNPHDYEQEVIIEKFPFKKQFYVNTTRFTVPPTQMVTLDIIWTPEEVGGFREMVQFHINQCYRLQAFLIGNVEAPKPIRKRKQGIGPRVKDPGTIIQTSSLTMIKSNYSLRRSHDLYEQWGLQGNDKENSKDVTDQENKQDIKTVPNAAVSKTDVNDVGCQSDAKRLTMKAADVSSPTPLESTAITGLLDKVSASLKNSRKQWRNILDITTPTLNTMSPIPHAEDNHNGVTVDSYFQPNETALVRCAPLVQEDKDLKKTFIMPMTLKDKAVTAKLLRCTEMKTSEDLPSTSATLCHNIPKHRDQTHVVEPGEVKSYVALSKSPSLVKPKKCESAIDLYEPHKSPASPRTMLNQSLSLISQMKLPRGGLSPDASDESINCSVISMGKGMVSPNSFLADMKSMRHNRSSGSSKSQNTSTPLVPSPLSIMNNSIPHSVMVSHLENIKQTLNSPLLGKKNIRRTPKSKLQTAKKSPKNIKSACISPRLKIKKKKTLMTSSSKIGSAKQVTTPSPNRKASKVLLKKKEGETKKKDLLRKSLTLQKSPAMKKTTKLNLLKRSPQSPSGLAKSRRKSPVICNKKRKSQVSASFSHEVDKVMSNLGYFQVGTSPQPEKKSCAGISQSSLVDDSLAPEVEECSIYSNLSLMESGKFFPDIETPDIYDEAAPVKEASIKAEEQDSQSLAMNEQTSTYDFKGKELQDNDPGQGVSSCHDEETSTSDFKSKSSKYLRVVQAAEKSLSPHKFVAMSPSMLPISPGRAQSNFRRGTMTITKLRPSDALLESLTRKKLFDEGTNTRLAGFPFVDEDTASQEEVKVRVEERYEEINGQLFLVVKETTDVVKSTSETYVEQIDGTPSEFLIPTHLQKLANSQSSQMSLSLNGNPLISPSQFLTPIRLPPSAKYETSSRQLNNPFSGVSPSQFLTPIRLPSSPDSQFSRRSTHVVNNPKVLKLEMVGQKCLSFENSPHTVTSATTNVESELSENKSSVSIFDTESAESLNRDVSRTPLDPKTYNLVGYDASSEEFSNCTLDSLDPSLSCDSLNKSIGNRNTSFTDVIEQQVNKTSEDVCKTRIKKDVLTEAISTDSKMTTEEDNISEENYYDTLSDNYYDAMSESEHDAEPLVKQATETGIVASSSSTENEAKEVFYSPNSFKMDQPVSESSSQQISPQHLESIDRIEQFVSISKEILVVHAAASETEMEPSGHCVADDRKNLRRSVSLVELGSKNDKNHSHTQLLEAKREESKAQEEKIQSNSAKIHEPGQPLTHRRIPLKNQSQTNLSSLKNRSLSLTTLVKQENKQKSPVKVNFGTKASEKYSKKPCAQMNMKLTSMVHKPLPKGLAQSKLILVKKPKAGAPKHPLPFAARNMYYDERWVEKQERGFTHWLNFVLTPPDEYLAVTTKTKVDAGLVSFDNRQVTTRLAPTKEVLSFRAYTARRRLNRLRRSACELYQSEAVVNVICKIEIEVESRRLAARKDKMIHADLGVKQRLLDLLLQYSSLWLRIGLETVFGEVVMLQSNEDVVGLSRFIVTRLLASPDIATEFAHPTVPHLYKDGYAAAAARHTIKKFLLLVYFLDQAKTSRIIDHDPCLFCKDADFKSSKEILIQFSKEVLSGEGDLTRHLAYLGYIVTQVQKPLDEYDYAVKNLSVDLRDGLRLSRVLELLAGNTNLMSKLRTPAISRLQKIHNMEAFFKVLADKNLNKLQVTPRDIVDGHREKTLLLLWHLIMHFQGFIHVNIEHLKEEIDLLLKSLKLKIAMQKMGALTEQDCFARRDSGETKLILENEGLQLIFQWCRLVCLHYGVKVENFTVSFSDGRALCCLIHHYHPALLTLANIKFMTTLSFQEAAEDQSPLNNDPDCSVDWNNGGLTPDENDPEFFQELLANEKSNFKLLYEKLSELGGVPLMIRSSDMSNTIPDEKVVSTCVSYLCGRLLDIREEVKAARIVQMAWRRRNLNRAIKLRQLKTKAAITIQQWIRPLLSKFTVKRKEAAATCIQAYVRRYLAQSKASQLRLQLLTAEENALKNRAAQIVQNTWRLYSARKQLATLKAERQIEENEIEQDMAAIVIQKNVKCWLKRKEFLEVKNSAIHIQAAWRMCLAQKLLEYLKFEHCNRSAIIVQKWVRGYLTFQHYSRLKSATATIQKSWRTFSAKKELLHMRAAKQNKSALVIQKFVRMKLAEKDFKKARNAAIVLQKHWRAYCARQLFSELKLKRLNASAALIQNVMRSITARQQFLRQKKSAMVIQKHWRAHCARQLFSELKVERLNASAILIQSVMKCVAARHQFLRQKRAVVAIQKHWRGILAIRQVTNIRIERHNTIVLENQRKFLERTQAALVIQKHWKKVLAMKKLSQLKLERDTDCAIVIQKYWRGFLVRSAFKKDKMCVILIQSIWRMILAKKLAQTMRKKKSALIIQKNWKKYLARRGFVSKRKAAIVIQSYWRMFAAWNSYMHKKHAVLILQNWNRSNIVARQQRANYLKQKQAAITIQKCFKGWCQQREKLKTVRAATVIQAYIKGFQCRRKYMAMKWAVLTIQRKYREYCVNKLAKQNYLKQKAANIIQRYWHQFLLNREAKRFKSASLIQSVVKKYFVRKQYLNQRKAAVKIQRQYRAYKLSRITRVDFLQQKQAATKIQSVFRMFCCRQDYLRMKYAAIVLQSWFRAWRFGEAVRRDYLLKRQAACTIQQFYKQLLARRRSQALYSAAVKIQSIYRGWSRHQDYLLFRAATVCIQRRYRARQLGQSVRREYETKKQAVLLIQRSWQHFKSRLEGQKLIAEQKKLLKQEELQRVAEEQRKAEMIQHRKLEAAVTIQRNFRLYLHQKEMVMINLAATVIQKYTRSFIARKHYLELKKMVICLQRIVRFKQQMLRERAHFLKIKKSVFVIQTAVMAWLMLRKVTQERSIIKIQAHWRMYRVKSAFCQASSEMKVLKSFTELKQKQIEFETKNSAALLIQKAYRQYSLRQTSQKHLAVLVIQRSVRKFLHNSKLKYDRAARVLQRTFRKFVLRKRLRIFKVVIKIQSVIRMHLARKHYTALQRSAVAIQAAVRVLLARRQLLLMRQKHEAAACIQAVVRGWITRKKYTADLNEKLAILRHDRLQQQSALKLQALWRGYKVRRDTKNVKIALARKKVKAAARAATTENTLGARTTSALDFLLCVRDLAQVLEALMRLDFATCHSVACCLQIIEVNAVPVLYKIIGGCNRSIPHMELIKYSISILLNLARCEKTSNYVLLTNENVATLLELLQIYRDKGHIFLNTCMLMGILALQEERKMFIRRHPQLVERLQGIYALTKHKQKTARTVEVTKAKVAATKSNNSLLVTPIVKKKTKKSQSKKVTEFTDPLVAIHYLMNVLDIEYK